MNGVVTCDNNLFGSTTLNGAIKFTSISAASRAGCRSRSDLTLHPLPGPPLGMRHFPIQNACLHSLYVIRDTPKLDIIPVNSQILGAADVHVPVAAFFVSKAHRAGVEQSPAVQGAGQGRMRMPADPGGFPARLRPQLGQPLLRCGGPDALAAALR